jgi:hypothetical protein
MCLLILLILLGITMVAGPVNDWMVAMIGCNSVELVCNSVEHIFL